MGEIHVNMLSSANKVAGQGVGGAYDELIKLLKNKAKKELKITDWFGNSRADITHFHTIDLKFYLVSFFKRYMVYKIGLY